MVSLAISLKPNTPAHWILFVILNLAASSSLALVKSTSLKSSFQAYDLNKTKEASIKVRYASRHTLGVIGIVAWYAQTTCYVYVFLSEPKRGTNSFLTSWTGDFSLCLVRQLTSCLCGTLLRENVHPHSLSLNRAPSLAYTL